MDTWTEMEPLTPAELDEQIRDYSAEQRCNSSDGGRLAHG